MPRKRQFMTAQPSIHKNIRKTRSISFEMLRVFYGENLSVLSLRGAKRRGNLSVAILELYHITSKCPVSKGTDCTRRGYAASVRRQSRQRLRSRACFRRLVMTRKRVRARKNGRMCRRGSFRFPQFCCRCADAYLSQQSEYSRQ